MERYEIRVAGHIDQRHARFLGCDDLRLLPDGDSLLVFDAVDQAALYGLLTRLRDAGLALIAAARLPAIPEPRTGSRPTIQRSKEPLDAPD